MACFREATSTMILKFSGVPWMKTPGVPHVYDGYVRKGIFIEWQLTSISNNMHAFCSPKDTSLQKQINQLSSLSTLIANVSKHFHMAKQAPINKKFGNYQPTHWRNGNLTDASNSKFLDQSHINHVQNSAVAHNDGTKNSQCYIQILPSSDSTWSIFNTQYRRFLLHKSHKTTECRMDG